MSIVSVRVDKKLKEKLEKAGINITREVKNFLEEMVWKIELRENIQKLSNTIEKMPPAEEGFSVRSVREDRESH